MKFTYTRLNNHIQLSVAILLLTLVSIPKGYSQQNLSAQWLTHSVGEQWDLISHMVADDKGNIYLAGNFSGTTAAEKGGRAVSGERDIFIAHYDSSGVNTWLHMLSSSSYCYISSIVVGTEDDFYICGYFREEFNLDGNSLYALAHSSMFVSHINNMGNVTWVKQLDADFRGRPAFLQIGHNNKLYLTATFSGELKFEDIEHTASSGTDILLAGFDNSGKLIDMLIIQSKGNSNVKDFLIVDNSLYLAGSFEKTMIINNDTLRSKGHTDAFFVKLDEKMKVVFSKQVGSIYDDFGSSIKIDNNENIIFAGSHTGEINFSKSVKIEPNGSYDVFICKYDSSGNLYWADNFGGLAGDILSDVNVNSFNDIYLTGNFRGEIEKGNSQIKSVDFSNDIFIAKYTATGIFRYIEIIGDTNTDLVRDIMIDNENNLLISGNFIDSFTMLNMEVDTALGSEYFLAKLYDCDFSPAIVLPADTNLCAEQFVIVTDSGFAEYQWNGRKGRNVYEVDTSGMYILKVIDKHKCVTIDTIVVQINPLPEVDLGDDLIVEQGEIVTLFAGYDFEKYLWNTEDTSFYIDIYTVNMIPGEYFFEVIVTDSNQCKTVDNLMLEVKGMEEKSICIVAYPNPVKDYLHLQVLNLESTTQLQIQLTSAKGDIILNNEYKITDGRFNHHFNLQHLNRGLYNLSIKYGEGVGVVKLVKL